MTIEQFKNIAPGQGGILLFEKEGLVRALNVSIVDARSTNTVSALRRITDITLTINGSQYDCEVQYVEVLNGYCFLDIVDRVLPVPTSEVELNLTYFTPSLELTDFEKSEYNVLKNNATFNRTTSFIFDVDRSKQEILPINYEAIKNGTASPASFQELNYTSIGITNSRYGGAKTSIDEYGISSAFAGKPIQAAIYPATQTTSSICSQSLSDRVIEEVIVGYSDLSATEDIEVTLIPVATGVSITSDINIGDTSITLVGLVDINPGDVIQIAQGTNLREIVKVVDVPLKSLVGTQLTVIRAYRSDIDPENNSVTFYDPGNLTISRLAGTQVFKAESNRLYRLSNKKIWIKENFKVFYVDEEGQVIFELVTCSL